MSVEPDHQYQDDHPLDQCRSIPTAAAGTQAARPRRRGRIAAVLTALSASAIALLPATTASAGVRGPGANPLSNPASASVAASGIQSDGPARMAHRVGAATSRGYNPAASSTNWSGYATYGATYTYAVASWVVPTVNCWWGATGASSTWVGLDGYGSTTVEQLGTRQNCLWGAASYYAWSEMYPASEQALPATYTVHPGDSMFAYVHFVGARYYFYMSDTTAGWVWGTSVSAPTPAPRNLSAEWITEQPSCFYECSWLANFGTVRFTRAYASTPYYGGPISAFPNDSITLASGSTTKATPSGLTPDSYGSDFSITFRHS